MIASSTRKNYGFNHETTLHHISLPFDALRMQRRCHQHVLQPSARVLYVRCVECRRAVQCDGKLWSVDGKTQIELVSSTGLKGYYPVDQLSKNFGLGLGGLIMGTSYQGEPLCYDLACPICDRSDRRLTLTADGHAKCAKCGVSYDLNNYGVIYQVPENAQLSTRRGLYRYRINFNGQIVNAYN